VVVDLGDVTDGQTVTLDVPPDAIGFDVVVTSAGALGIERIASPAGAVVHDRFTPKNGGLANGEAVRGVASVSVPQNDLPESVLVPGGWKITFGGQGTAAHARARIQTTGDGRFHGGALDLHLYVPAGLTISDPSPLHVVSAKTAAADVDVARRVDTFFSALHQSFAIDRGKVVFHEAPSRFVAVNDDATYYAGTAISTGQPEDYALHVLLTNDLYHGDYVGYSPGLPGTVSVTGTPYSGLVVALYDGGEGAIGDGHSWLHEMGHFVGLFHTTEPDGTTFDPLSDTPKCPGTRTPSCADADNLMIPGAWPAGDKLPLVTKGQQTVFRASPIYRSYGPDHVPAIAEPATSGATITRSGRALQPIERWLAGTFCGSSRQSPEALVAAYGGAATIAALDAIAVDDDLPRIYRAKARRVRARIP
jgi:hypothetical protein